MPRLLALLVLSAVLLSGCTFPAPIQELEFPRTVRPGESAQVVWSVDGFERGRADHYSKFYWSHDGKETHGSLEPSIIGDGPVSRTTDCPPYADCSEWTGLHFVGHLSPLDEGEHVYYKAVVWMDGQKSQSPWIKLEGRSG